MFCPYQEQFTSDWDRVNLRSDPFSDGITGLDQNLNDVAANYGAWSNIYQVGQVGLVLQGYVPSLVLCFPELSSVQMRLI